MSATGLRVGDLRARKSFRNCRAPDAPGRKRNRRRGLHEERHRHSPPSRRGDSPQRSHAADGPGYAKEFGEFAVGDGGEKRFAAGEVVIDGHGSDADGPGDAAHADGFGPSFSRIEEPLRAMRSAVPFVFTYTVYSIQRISATLFEESVMKIQELPMIQPVRKTRTPPTITWKAA